MSQTESNRQIYTVNKWYGGMSNDEYSGSDGCFYDGEGIEIRRNSREITLNRDPLFGNANPFQLGTTSGEITCFNKYYDTPTTYSFLAGTALGKIEDLKGTGYEFTLSGQYPILTMGVLQDFSTSGAPGFNYGFCIDARGGLYRWLWTSNPDAGILQTNFTSGVATYNFTVSNSSSASNGATYTNNGQTFTVIKLTTGLNTLQAVQSAGASVPTPTGILTKTSGTGDATITYTAGALCGLMNPSGTYQTTNLGPCAPYIVTQNTLIYGVGNLIYMYDLTKSPWALSTANPIQIDKGYTIKAITKIDSQIIIYTANDTLYNTTIGYNTISSQGGANGKIYYYSFQSLATANPPDRTIDWKDRPILAVASRSNIDFVLTGSPYRRALYRNDGGYSPTVLFQSAITNTQSSRFYFNPLYGSNSVGAYGNLMMFPASEKLYTYGTVTNGLPDALVKEFTLTGYTPTCYYVDDTSTGARLYIGAKKNSETYPNTNTYYFAPYLNIRGSNDYVTGGFVTINPTLGEGVHQKKRPVKCNIAYNLEANTSITLYATLDDGTETLVDSTAVGGGYGRKTIIMSAFNDFYKIKFRAVLNTTNQIYTPHLFSLQLVYDVIEDEMT